MLRSIGKQSGGIRGVSPGEEKVGYGGKDLQKKKVLNVLQLFYSNYTVSQKKQDT